MFDFMSGLITMGFLVSSCFFLKFWNETADWLFFAFAGAFALLALNQALLALIDLPREELSPVYLLRVAAFLLIIAGVIWKNKRAGTR